MGKLTALKRPKVAIPLVIIVLILAAVVLAIKNMNAPAQGTITSPPDNNDSSATQSSAPKTFSDKYVSFSYPSKFQVNSKPKDKGYLDATNFIALPLHDEFLAISLIREPLASDSGVMYRQRSTAIYKSVQNTGSSLVFSKLDNKEYTGFVAHGGIVLAISLSSISPMNLSSDYNAIANSLEWRQ